jgi:CelD/BcsL family acetyltransferase involved in cellulose biosynthesis
VAQGRPVVARSAAPELDVPGEAWDGLLARSSADPLFNSRQWLTTWWSQYGGQLGAELNVRSVTRDGRLTGLGLFMRRTVAHRLGLRGRRLELLGTARGAPGVAFSERTELVLEHAGEDEAMHAIARDLVDDASWDELFVSYTPEDSPTHRVFREVAAACGGYLRVADHMEAWEISLDGDFASFLASLGSGTRARLMGSRKRLAEAGEVRERLLRVDEMENGWDIFCRLHESRWQRAFSDHWRRFYGTIAAAQAGQGGPVMSVLEFNGEPISLLVNFRAGRREYSMASAFVPVDVKRVSPGWLHLGLAIERAFADGMEVFDFLGGEGKNEQYKAAFGGHSRQLLCLQLLRPPQLKWLYRGWDGARRLRERLRGSRG